MYCQASSLCPFPGSTKESKIEPRHVRDKTLKYLLTNHLHIRRSTVEHIKDGITKYNQ